jgi:hypothetical protein
LRRAAGQEQPLRRRPALLPAVELHGLVDLNVQPRHELPGDLRDRGLVRVLRFFVGAAQAHEAFLDLELLGHIELQLRFIGKVLCDGVGAQVNAAGEHFALFKEEQIAGLGANVQQHGAIFQIAVIVAEGIAQGRR